jgi:hypothetical protein
MFAGVSQKNQNRPEHTVSNRNFHCFVLNLQTILLGLSDDPEVVLAQLALVPVGLVQPDLQTVQMGQSYGALAATGRQEIPRTVAPRDRSDKCSPSPARLDYSRTIKNLYYIDLDTHLVAFSFFGQKRPGYGAGVRKDVRQASDMLLARQRFIRFFGT